MVGIVLLPGFVWLLPQAPNADCVARLADVGAPFGVLALETRTLEPGCRSTGRHVLLDAPRMARPLGLVDICPGFFRRPTVGWCREAYWCPAAP